MEARKCPFSTTQQYLGGQMFASIPISRLGLTGNNVLWLAPCQPRTSASQVPRQHKTRAAGTSPNIDARWISSKLIPL